MTIEQDNDAEMRFWQSPWAVKALHLLISTVIATAGASWAVRSYLSDRDQKLADRFAQIDQKLADHTANLERLNHDIVPRTEHEQYWKSVERRLDEIHDDLREIRRVQDTQRKP